jgi:hypothetical protein
MIDCRLNLEVLEPRTLLSGVVETIAPQVSFPEIPGITFPAGPPFVVVSDADDVSDIEPGDVTVVFGANGYIPAIVIGGWDSGPMTGLSLSVAGATGVGVIVDARPTPSPLHSVNVTAPVGGIYLRDGVDSGVFIGGKLGVGVFGGEIAGDVVADAVGVFVTYNGGISGSLAVANELRVLVSHGPLTGEVHADSVAYMYAQRAEDAQIAVRGKLTTLVVGGTWTDSSLTARELSVVVVSGSVRASQPDTHNIWASSGSFWMIERGVFSPINTLWGGPETILSNVSVAVLSGSVGSEGVY